MSHLYWSFHRQESDNLLRHLREFGREFETAGVANGLSVIHFREPDDVVLKETARLIARKQLKSAALVSAPLLPENLYVAAEWWHRFVFAESESAAAERLGPWLRRLDDYRLPDLIIFEVREGDVVDSPDVDEIEGLGEIAARPVSISAVRADPGKYYGRLASPDTGGANALFAAGREAADLRGLGPDTVLVGAPGVFGFDVDEGETSVVAWRRNGVIAVQAFGFRLPMRSDEARYWEGFPQGLFEQKAITSEIADWERSGISFGLAVVLHGLDDPPVVIPMGSVYQQPVMGSRIQNLAVAQASKHMVSAGSSVPLVLPAWCLNPTFSPPNGPMVPTPLVATGASGTQAAVWNDVRRRYRGTP